MPVRSSPPEDASAPSRLERNGVVVGRDGWLFWVGPGAEMLRLYRGGPRVRVAVWRWARLLGRRRDRARALRTRYIHCVVPDKLTVHAARLPFPLPPGGGIAARLMTELGRRDLLGMVVDLPAAFAALPGDPEIHLRTDTHWTYAGAHAAAEAVAAAGGFSIPSRLGRPEQHPPRAFVFDLGSKLDPPVAEHRHPLTVAIHARRIEENALARLRREPGMANAPGFHGGSRIVFRNDDPDAAPLRICLFGDSFSNEDGYSLAVLLGESVRELHSIWSPRIDWDYVRRVQPDLVVGEIAERFLRRVPRDGFDVDAFAEARVRARSRAPRFPRFRRLAADFRRRFRLR